MSYKSVKEAFMRDIGNERLANEMAKIEAKNLTPKEREAEIKALELGVKIVSNFAAVAVYANVAKKGVKKLFRLG